MELKQPIVNFLDYSCSMQFGYYDKESRALCIQLVSAKTDPNKDLMMGEPIARATVNHPVISPAPNMVIVKNYNENEGMADALVNAGLVKAGVGKVFTTEFGAEMLMMEKTTLLIDLENEYRKDHNIPELKIGQFENTGDTVVKRPKP